MKHSDPTLVLEDLASALQQASEEGSPVSGRSPETWSKLASVALRRIESFQRRGVPAADSGRQVVDLAKGLVAHSERHPSLVGRLMTDYEYVAAKLLDAYGRNSGNREI